MIGAEKEYFVNRIADRNDEFWSYYIFHEKDAGKPRKYNVIRINATCEKMEVLGRELSLKQSRMIIENEIY